MLPVINPAIHAFKSKYPKGEILSLRIVEETAPSGLTDIKVDADAEIGGSTANFAVYVKSSDNTKDKPSGVGCLTALLVGLTLSTDDYGQAIKKYVSEIITLNGTTKVNAANSYLEVIDLFPLTHGSELNPAGNLTVCKTVGDTTLLTVTAGNLFSKGNKIFVPSGYYAQILGHTGELFSRTDVDEAVQIDVRFTGFDSSDMIRERIVIGPNSVKENYVQSQMYLAGAGAYIDFQDNLIVAANVYDAEIFIGITNQP